MENVSKVSADTSSAGPMNPLSHSEDWRLARTVHGDLVLMGMPRVNLHFIGRDRVTRSVLEMLMLDLRAPLASWHSGETVAPPRTVRGGTLILHDVSALTPDEQRQLLEWLDWDGGRTQVVSTTPVSLAPRVQAGTFIERLYYRLNTVCVDVTD